MRDYATVSPVFWTGQTGRRLKQAGPDAMLVAMYLVTSPHSNAMGMFYLPTLYISHETGLTLEGASKALVRACEEGFCAYDDEAEVVWVFEMARFQIGQALSPKDNRVKWVNEEYVKLPKCRFLKDFFNKYATAFHLKESREGSPSEVPSEPHRSQEQDQEQEQEKEEPSLRSGSCPEVAEPPAGRVPAELPKLVGTLPLADGSDFEVRQDLVDKLSPLYPAVDVIQALRSMKSWLIGHPKKRKTKRGAMAFITSWLDREQNRGGNMQTARASPQPRTYQEYQREERRGTAIELMQAMGMTGGRNAGVDEARRVGGDAVFQHAAGELLPKVAGGTGRLERRDP